MRESNSYFILHVSDFHISEKTQKNIVHGQICHGEIYLTAWIRGIR